MMRRVVMQLLQVQIPFWVILPFLGLSFLFGIGGGILINLSGGSVLARQFFPATECPETAEICSDFSVFWQAWDLARNNFVEPDAVVPSRMIEGAISGMLSSLGDEGHTRFLSAEAAERWQESISASFEGIGAYVDVREGQAIIVSPIPGSPAEAAGLLEGDAILQVDGQDTNGWTVEELVTHVRGPRGTTVVLKVIHEGETVPVEIMVQRDNVEVPSVSWTMLPGNVAFLRLNSFAQRSSDEMEQALSEARAQGAQSLILDLRDNPGGLVNEAIDIAGQFLPEGTTVLLEEDREGERKASTTRRAGVALDMPMVVLVNNNTASSSEIVSGALQDAGRARIIGVPTIGTGTVLSTFRLNNGSQLLLGTSQWLTPNGRLIRNQGITPDVEVMLAADAEQLSPDDAEDLSASELRQSEDAQFVEALEQVENLARQ